MWNPNKIIQRDNDILTKIILKKLIYLPLHTFTIYIYLYIVIYYNLYFLFLYIYIIIIIIGIFSI
jgi:hypothetical protein